MGGQGSRAAREYRSRPTRKIEDPEARARMVAGVRARALQAGRLCAAGAALAGGGGARAAQHGAREQWRVRRGKLFLVPGDSALGYRLPLGSLPYVPPSDYPYHPRPRHDRAARAAARLSRSGSAGAGGTDGASSAVEAVPAAAGGHAAQERVEQHIIEGAVRTAVTVEPRGDHLAVFLPPTEALEDYLELVAAGRGDGRGDAACRCGSRAMPRRPIRGCRCSSVTPDPGVIEVNVQPGVELGARRSRSPRTLYDMAREMRADRRQVHGRRPLGRHRRRQPSRARRAVGDRFAVHPPAGPAQELRALLAAASVAQLSVLGHVHRPDQPGAAHRRGAPRRALRTGDRAGAGAAARRGRDAAAVGGRSAVPQPAGRRDRQHPPHRDLHRQAVLARRADRPARPGRVPRVRDAARARR